MQTAQQWVGGLVSSGDKRRIRMQMMANYIRAASRGEGLDEALQKSY